MKGHIKDGRDTSDLVGFGILVDDRVEIIV